MQKKKSYLIKGDAKEKWLRNLLKFTAPLLAIIFAQLALGASIKEAGLVALYAMYSLIADYFKKLK